MELVFIAMGLMIWPVLDLYLTRQKRRFRTLLIIITSLISTNLILIVPYFWSEYMEHSISVYVDAGLNCDIELEKDYDWSVVDDDIFYAAYSGPCTQEDIDKTYKHLGK